MATETATQLAARLAHTAPLTAERFTAALGADLHAAEMNQFWQTYNFQLPEGVFAYGELRLNAAGDGALLILEPRDPHGLVEAEVDRAALGRRRQMRSNPNIPPEGIDAEYFEMNGVAVIAQWTVRSHRLRSIVLKWERPPAT